MPEETHPQVEKSVEERDREWLETVYKPMQGQRQLTVRAIAAGMVFGGLMSLSNLYVGLRSGWGLGVDIAAVIVIFAIFKALRAIGLSRREFGMMESTIMMTVAVAASWISSAGLVSAVPALTMLTGYTFVWWHLTLLIGVILYLGLFMAIPLKRQMIQIDRLRFPANIPTGVTLKAMYSHGGEAMKKAKSLGLAGLSGIIVAVFRDGVRGVIPGLVPMPAALGRIGMGKLTLSFEPSLIFIGIGALFGIKVGLSMLFGFVLNYGVLAPNLINEKIIVHPAPQVRAAEAAQFPLSMQPGESFTVVLTEANVSPELSAGARSDTFTYAWKLPVTYLEAASLKDALGRPSLDDGTPNPFHGVISVRDTLDKSIGARVLLVEASKAIHWEAQLTIPEEQPEGPVKSMGFALGASRTQVVGGFRNISAWSLWPGATILVVGGLLALAFQWKTLGRTFASIFRGLGGSRKSGEKGLLDDIEVPMSWFLPGFLITGLAAALLLMWLFNIHWYMGIIAVVMTFFLAAVAARAGAEIGINPIGALGKVTQHTYGVIAPGNMTTNLMTAGVTAGAACSCSVSAMKSRPCGGTKWKP